VPKSIFVQDWVQIEIPEASLWPAFTVELRPLDAEAYGKVQAQMERTPAERRYADVFVPMIEDRLSGADCNKAVAGSVAKLHPALIDRLAGILLNGVGGILKN